MEQWDLGGGRAMKKSSRMCITPVILSLLCIIFSKASNSMLNRKEYSRSKALSTACLTVPSHGGEWGLCGRRTECLGHKSTLPKGEEEMDGIVNSDVLKGVVFDGNVSIDAGGGGFRV